MRSLRSRRSRFAFVLLLLAAPLLVSTVITAAQAQTPTLPGDQPQLILDQGSATRPVLMGIGLGAAGFFVGGLTGLVLANDCSGEMCDAGPFLFGAAAGGTLGLALGAHLGNHRRGNLALDFLTGAAIWGAGLGIVAATGWDETAATAAAVTVPIVQLAGTVMVERAVGRSRAMHRMSLAIAPDLRGGARVAAAVPF
jgi:hypothetical protein